MNEQYRRLRTALLFVVFDIDFLLVSKSSTNSHRCFQFVLAPNLRGCLPGRFQMYLKHARIKSSESFSCTLASYNGNESSGNPNLEVTGGVTR